MLFVRSDFWLKVCGIVCKEWKQIVHKINYSISHYISQLSACIPFTYHNITMLRKLVNCEASYRNSFLNNNYDIKKLVAI